MILVVLRKRSGFILVADCKDSAVRAPTPGGDVQHQPLRDQERIARRLRLLDVGMCVCVCVCVLGVLALCVCSS